MSRWTRGVVACAAALLLGTACSGAVEIDAPELSAADASACRDLLDALPGTVADQEQRPVAPEAAPGAAWGDPAIVLTCGVGQPDDFTETSTCVQADGVGWFVPDSVLTGPEDRDVTMTAVGYRPRVRVVVPGDYRPEGFAAAAVEIGRAVDATLTLETPCR